MAHPHRTRALESFSQSDAALRATIGYHTIFEVHANRPKVFLSFAQTMAGVMSIDMPGILRAFNYLSPLRYAIRNLAPYSLRSIVFTCTEAQKLPNGDCPISTGEQVLDLWNLNTNPTLNIVWVVVVTVLYRLAAWGLLRIYRTHWEGGRTRKVVYKEHEGGEVEDGTGVGAGTGSGSG
jgi:hypothetical protein